MVTLPQMRVASAIGFGEQPEDLAWEKILSWARDAGVLEDLDAVRFFGFNNPSPLPGSPNYGYEQWMTLPEGGSEAEVTPADEIELKTLAGGLYAVTRCTLLDIGEKWQQLVIWGEDSAYEIAHHRQCLEEAITPPGTPFEEMVLDLYLPITK
jgi:DNA gyrase inhibitor GyrI